MTAIVLKPAVSVLSDLKARLWTLFATIAAASAAAHAVENRRQPAAADLRQLGLEGARFNLNF